LPLTPNPSPIPGSSPGRRGGSAAPHPALRVIPGTSPGDRLFSQREKGCRDSFPLGGKVAGESPPDEGAVSDLTSAEVEALLRSDFYSFLVRVFAERNGAAAFVAGWHIEVMAARLAALREGGAKRLIVNIPPRHLKSLAASIALPAWLLGHDPRLQIVNATYAQDLSDAFARDCRAVMASAWYRALFPTRLRAARPPLRELITTRGGSRIATSVGGVLTGRGADVILIDDPLKPSDAMSESRRGNVNSWFDGTLYSRLNDKAKGSIVIVMQRLHEDDLVGHVLKQEGWEILSFPAIAEADETHEIATSYFRLGLL
jgi:hypothetical protein